MQFDRQQKSCLSEYKMESNKKPPKYGAEQNELITETKGIWFAHWFHIFYVELVEIRLLRNMMSINRSILLLALHSTSND